MRTQPLAAALALLLATAAVAGKFNRVLDVGDKAPEFQDLMGIDGQRHSLSDFEDSEVLVVCFTCNHCPVAKAYEDRLIQFVNDYQDKDVAFVAISVSRLKIDRLPAMKTRAKQSGFNFPYLYDPAQQTGRKFGATCTPHTFVLDQNRNVAYMGAFDDNMTAEKVTEPFVRLAVDALLSGKTPEVKETRQRGCEIEYQ